MAYFFECLKNQHMEDIRKIQLTKIFLQLYENNLGVMTKNMNLQQIVLKLGYNQVFISNLYWAGVTESHFQ